MSLEIKCLDKICSLYPYPAQPIENEMDIKKNLPTTLFAKLVSRQKFLSGDGPIIFLKCYQTGAMNCPTFTMHVDLLNMTGAELTQKVKTHLNKNVVLVNWSRKVDDNLKLNMQDISEESTISYIVKM